MKRKTIILIAAVTVAIAAGGTALYLMKTPAASAGEDKNTIIQFMQYDEAVEIELAAPKDSRKGEALPLKWVKLGELETYSDTLRKSVDSLFGINGDSSSGKSGCIYQIKLSNGNKKNSSNSTLKTAMCNEEFRGKMEDKGILEALSEAASNTFTDLEKEGTDGVYAAVNGYFNLLSDTEEPYANIDSTLSRAEFMAMAYRADTPVKEITPDSVFAEAVGESEYKLYAQGIEQYSYLDIATKSLNEKTYKGKITRAEAVYIIMKMCYGEELSETSTDMKLKDVKDAGDLIKKHNLTEKGDYSKSDAVRYMLESGEGAPTELYQALCLAVKKGIIEEETRYDEAITKGEAIQLLMDTYATLPIIEEEAKSIDWSEEDYDTKIIDSENGAVYENIGSKVPEGTATTWDEYKAKMDSNTVTIDDMRQLMKGKIVRHNEDGSVKRHEDGTVDTSWKVTLKDENGFTYWLLDDGTEVHPGERDPVDGVILGGDAHDGNYIPPDMTEEDWAALDELAELGIGK